MGIVLGLIILWDCVLLQASLKEVMHLAAALEVQSEHPLASAVINFAADGLGYGQQRNGLHPWPSMPEICLSSSTLCLFVWWPSRFHLSADIGGCTEVGYIGGRGCLKVWCGRQSCSGKGRGRPSPQAGLGAGSQGCANSCR